MFSDASLGYVDSGGGGGGERSDLWCVWKVELVGVLMLWMWVVREREQLRMTCLTSSRQKCIFTIRKLLIMNACGKLSNFP